MPAPQKKRGAGTGRCLADNLTALMEPMIMAVLGVLVGGLIIAMYLPIFQMGQVVG